MHVEMCANYSVFVTLVKLDIACKFSARRPVDNFKRLIAVTNDASRIPVCRNGTLLAAGRPLPEYCSRGRAIRLGIDYSASTPFGLEQECR